MEQLLAQMREEDNNVLENAAPAGEDVDAATKTFMIQQDYIGRILGSGGVTIQAIKAKHGCNVTINQETRDKGYSVCTIRGATDEVVNACKLEIEEIMDQNQEKSGHAQKDVQIPQKFVGMIIGSGGSTIVKIRRHTGAEIAMVQDTAAEGFSTAQISGTEEQVAKAVDVIGKMVESGRLAAESYAEYLGNVQAGKVASQPFKPEKMPGLEFLEEANHDMMGGKGGRNSGMGGMGGGRQLGMLGGGKGIRGGSGVPVTFVDAGAHTHKDTFEVPKKYLGLLIGKQGEAIRRFRQYAAERNMAIVVQQDSQDGAGTVIISGVDLAEITALKADMTQNLFKAISMLDNGRGAFPDDGPSMFNGGGNKGFGKKGFGKGNMNRASPYGDVQRNNNLKGSGSFDGGFGGFGNKGFNNNNGGGKGFNNNGGFNNGGQNETQPEFWADMFSQILKRPDQQPQGSPTKGGQNWGGDGWSPQGGPSFGESPGNNDSSSDLGSALAALLGGGGSTW